jgi:hypothetical protein
MSGLSRGILQLWQNLVLFIFTTFSLSKKSGSINKLLSQELDPVSIRLLNPFAIANPVHFFRVIIIANLFENKPRRNDGRPRAG